MDFEIAYINYGSHKASTYYPLHKHNCFEIVYYISGNGTTNINNSEFDFTSSSFAVILPEVNHDQTNDDDVKTLYIGFTYKHSSISLEDGVFFDKGTRNVLKLLENIRRELLSKELYYRKKLELLINELLIEIKRVNNVKKVKSDNMKFITNFINENYTQKIDLGILSEISGYSYHRFRHLFKERTGYSPINYIINKKINYSKKLIMHTDLSMSSIAQESGFSNSSQFTFLFKKHLGITPIQYRKTNLKI